MRSTAAAVRGGPRVGPPLPHLRFPGFLEPGFPEPGFSGPGFSGLGFSGLGFSEPGLVGFPSLLLVLPPASDGFLGATAAAAAAGAGPHGGDGSCRWAVDRVWYRGEARGVTCSSLSSAFRLLARVW